MIAHATLNFLKYFYQRKSIPRSLTICWLLVYADILTLNTMVQTREIGTKWLKRENITYFRLLYIFILLDILT